MEDYKDLKGSKLKQKIRDLKRLLNKVFFLMFIILYEHLINILLFIGWIKRRNKEC